MTVGDLIAKFREEHHMSQRKFATLCGLSNGYIWMIEKNLNPQTGRPPEISPEALKAIAETMGMTMDELARKVDPGTKIYRRVNPLEGLDHVSTTIPFPPPITGESKDSKLSIVSDEPWDVDEAFTEQDADDIRIMARGMIKGPKDKRKILIDMAKQLFAQDYDEEGNKRKQ